MFNQKKVLVTGGAGFIGSAICETLVEKGFGVVCLDNFITGKRENVAHLSGNPLFTLIEGDIRNEDDCKRAMTGVDVVLHQAALGSVPRSINDPITTNAHNIDGFINVLWGAHQAGIKRVVYASSSSVYGDSASLPKIENITGAPISPYAVTKKVNELYAKVFADCYGLELIGLRYFNVYGRRQDPYSTYAAVIPKFVYALRNHESPVINGNGDFTRDFTYIDDVVQMNLLAAETTNTAAINQVYNVAAGDRNTILRLFELLRQNLAFHDEAIAKVNPILGPERPGDIPHSLASIEKAVSLLGYSPKFRLEQGIQKTVEWYMAHLTKI